MEYRVLGKTGLRVSAIGLGCAELGMDYGIKIPGEYGKPSRDIARNILYTALDAGINVFDTAPGYGDSENLLGDILGSKECYVATKISIPGRVKNPYEAVRSSVEKSLANLKRECLDIVQIHNTKSDEPGKTEVVRVLQDLKKKGLIRFIGDSVYGPEAARVSIQESSFDIIQVAYSILDQRMSDAVLPEAREKNIGIISRSAYFRGILSNKVAHLNDDFVFLKNVVDRIKNEAGIDDWEELTETALRFCLSQKNIDATLVGVRTLEELEFALKAESKGFLPGQVFTILSTLGIKDAYWVDPLNWYLKL